jgi:secondary thiamine-phosphate synthase enzyme
MKVEHHIIRTRTKGRGLYDVTREVAHAVERTKVRDGLCTVFIEHTSASLVVQENADPSVRRDLERWIERIAPEDPRAYEHDAEGPDDMPAHLRSSITRTSETFPVQRGALALGTWQAIYVWEHRRAPQERRVTVTVMGVSG